VNWRPCKLLGHRTTSTTITAPQVIIQPTGDYGSGASSTSKQVGQIAANYSEGYQDLKVVGAN